MIKICNKIFSESIKILDNMKFFRQNSVISVWAVFLKVQIFIVITEFFFYIVHQAFFVGLVYTFRLIWIPTNSFFFFRSAAFFSWIRGVLHKRSNFYDPPSHFFALSDNNAFFWLSETFFLAISRRPHETIFYEKLDSISVWPFRLKVFSKFRRKSTKYLTLTCPPLKTIWLSPCLNEFILPLVLHQVLVVLREDLLANKIPIPTSFQN